MYGITRSPEYAELNAYPFKRWFASIYDFIQTTIALKTVTAAYTIEATLFYIRGDATAGAFAVTLPPALNLQGRQILIKKVDASGNAVTVTAAGGDTIEGAGTVVLAAQWAKTLLISNGNATWEKVV